MCRIPESTTLRGSVADDIATNRYPKHVWSPAGGWYAQPKNWRANTAIMLGVVVGITAMAWSVSAEREHRYKMPEVCLPSTCRDWEDNGGMLAIKLKADIFGNSLTGSHLRDTGRSRLLSTRLRRSARDPHRGSTTARVRCGITAFYGKQRDERLWERHLYICEEANRQVPPMLFGWHL